MIHLPTSINSLNRRSKISLILCSVLILTTVVPSFATSYSRPWWRRWHRATTTTTTATTAAPTTTNPATTTAATKPTTTTTTTKPATTTPSTPVPSSAFPTQATTGIEPGVVIKTYSGSLNSSSIAGTTEVVDGVSYKVIDGYLIDVPAGSYFSISGQNTLIRNTRFIGHGEPSNTSALVQAGGSITIRFDNVELNANGYSRGIQSDTAHIIVNKSKLLNTSDSAVEKNDRSMSSDFTVTNTYIASDCSWTSRDSDAHTDGLQWGGARNVLVKNNAILIQANMNGCVSNSAIGGWAELGNVNSSVIDHNLLGGGGATMYLESKGSFTWGSATITNNVFDRRYGGAGCSRTGQTSGLWKVLYPGGLPANLVWSGNTFDDGSSVSIALAKQELGC